MFVPHSFNSSFLPYAHRNGPIAHHFQYQAVKVGISKPIGSPDISESPGTVRLPETGHDVSIYSLDTSHIVVVCWMKTKQLWRMSIQSCLSESIKSMRTSFSGVSGPSTQDLSSPRIMSKEGEVPWLIEHSAKDC